MEGGYYDCGDHLKESQTQMYAFMVAALMAATNADADEDHYAFNHGETVNRDGIPDMLREAKHGADFVLRAYKRAKGVIDDMALSVGDFGSDHGWWGRPESQDKLPLDPSRGDPALRRGGPLSRTVRLGEIGANIGGETAAGLAILSKMYAEYDKPFADSCLKVAREMYEFGKELAQGKTFTHNKKAAEWSSPAYNGNNEFVDDMALASVALLYATGEKQYADDMIRNTNMYTGQPTNEQDGPGYFKGGWFVSPDKGFLKNGKNTSWANSYAYATYALYKLILADENKAINEYGLTADVDESREDVVLAADHVGVHQDDLPSHRSEMLHDVVERRIPPHPDYLGFHARASYGGFYNLTGKSPKNLRSQTYLIKELWVTTGTCEPYDRRMDQDSSSRHDV